MVRNPSQTGLLAVRRAIGSVDAMIDDEVIVAHDVEEEEEFQRTGTGSIYPRLTGIAVLLFLGVA